MARKERYTKPAIYHVINRGVEKRNVYLEPEDYEFFMNLLVEMNKEFDVIIHSFCLMTNHYHILAETKKSNISKALQFVNGKYAKYFNRKYTRNGHLWQGRYKSYPLFDDAHFWIVAKYIERNPLKANMVKEIYHYKYQSFFQWCYNHTYFNVIKDSKIFDMTLKEYTDFILTDMNVENIDMVYDSPKLISINGKKELLLQRLETFFELDKDISRNENIKKALSCGYTKSEIAKFLSLSPSTITKITKEV